MSVIAGRCAPPWIFLISCRDTTAGLLNHTLQYKRLSECFPSSLLIMIPTDCVWQLFSRIPLQATKSLNSISCASRLERRISWLHHFIVPKQLTGIVFISRRDYVAEPRRSNHDRPSHNSFTGENMTSPLVECSLILEMWSVFVRFFAPSIRMLTLDLLELEKIYTEKMKH